MKVPGRRVAEERKTVTVLVCDLVGFTAITESADPEDVNQMLAAYEEMARTQIERHGGVVEKFIGDAVVGVFGVPAAHEDDPERAVRAGLRIIEAAEELETVGGGPLRLRVGIDTGEAIVRLGIAARSGGQLLTGDAVNTASRLQSVAPEMGVVVGLVTYEATAATFAYQELDPASLKGKSQPVRVFRPTAPRARLGVDLTRTHDTPFIGREIDLALLKGIFDKTMAAGSPQLVTVVGEPGLGKTRVVAELATYVDLRPELVTWRQGRCLPYGEAITFWALGEIVKAHAGILESDPPGVAVAKLEAVLPEDTDRAWFRERLLPLLGIEASSPAEREELFTAWRRFVEHIAERQPTVLVFEDLHWADDAMLEFLEHLAGHAEAGPLLVIGTARPELFARRPHYAAGLHNVNRINLEPLSPTEIARLVSAVLQTELSAELQQAIQDRTEGNPLYAKEFVRLLRDRELMVRHGSGWELRHGAAIPSPDSIRALIAARLDALEPEAKSMLADAAVIGKTFWPGALAAMGERNLDDVAGVLRELTRKELVRRVRDSSIQGETAYEFSHILARDVAYAQLPRASRIERHVAVAAWIGAKASERGEDLADVLAHHYATALELARASGDRARAAELEEPALRLLSVAGERALGLDTDAALASLDRALALAPIDHPERAGALARFGEAAFQAGRHVEATAALEEAVGVFRARGDLLSAARAMGTLSAVLLRTGDPRGWELPAQALALLEPLGPSPALIAALGEVAAGDALQGKHEQTVLAAERALTLATDLRLPRPYRALGFRGMARAMLGDRGGLADFREAIRLATEAGQGREVALLHNNLANALWAYEGPAAALRARSEAAAYAKARGLTEAHHAVTLGSLDLLIDAGEHETALDVAAELAPHLQGSGDTWSLTAVLAAEVRIRAWRGEADEVAERLDWLETAAREVGDPQGIVGCLGASALARHQLGQDRTAAALLAEIEGVPGARDNQSFPGLLPAMVRTALAAGAPALAERLATGLEPRYPLAEHAIATAAAALAEARLDLDAATGSYADAAVRWERFGVSSEQALGLLGLGRSLLALGRPLEAEPVLRRAREIFERLGGAPLVAASSALLQRAVTR